MLLNVTNMTIFDKVHLLGKFLLQLSSVVKLAIAVTQGTLNQETLVHGEFRNVSTPYLILGTKRDITFLLAQLLIKYSSSSVETIVCVHQPSCYKYFIQITLPRSIAKNCTFICPVFILKGSFFRSRAF